MFHKMQRKRSFGVAFAIVSSLLLLLTAYQNCGGSLIALNSDDSTSSSSCEGGDCSSVDGDGDETSPSASNEGEVHDPDPILDTPGGGGEPETGPVVPPSNGTQPSSENQWIQVAKRTKAQKTEGLSGGEGCQMIFGIAYAPSNPNIAYFINDTTGVHKSTNANSDNPYDITWHKKSFGFGAIGGVSIVVHPTNPDIVYVAGGRIGYQGSDTTGFIQGIFRTTDGGNNWTLVKSAEFQRNSSQGGVHIVFAGSNMYAAPVKTGILKSTDNGVTWNFLTTSGGKKILDTLNLNNIAAHPKDNTILYVSTSKGLYKIVDSGSSATVTKIGTGLPSGAVYQLQIDHSSPNTMYIAAGSNGVYWSTDGGTNFSTRNNGLSTPLGAGGKIRYMAMSPVNASKLIVTFRDLFGKYVYYSSDGGANWTQTTNMDESNEDGWVAGSVFGYTQNQSGVDDANAPVVFHPTNQNIALAIGWGNQVKKTTDGGVTWKYANTGYIGMGGGVQESSSAIGWDSTNYNRAVFTHGDWGSMVTENNEDTFTSRVTVTHNNRQATAAGAMYGNIIAQAVGQTNDSSSAQVIAISRDAGANWTKIESATAFFKFIEFHPQNNNIVYAGKYKFYDIQTNNDYVSIADERAVAAVFKGQTGTQGNTVYSWSGNVIYKSTNAGGSWTTPYPNLPSDVSVRQIAVDPVNENRIYAVANGKGVYIINDTSANGGTATLKNDAHGIELDQFGEINTNSMAVDPNVGPNNETIIYVGTRANWKGMTNGVFRSIDSGNTWTNITRDTFGTMFEVRSISVRPDNSYVYISSYSGTWKLPPPSSTSTVDEMRPHDSI